MAKPETSTDDSANEQPVFTERDDRFHFDAMGNHDWWATETCWFSFHNAERKLGGWLYNLIRPNIGTVAGGAWIWDADEHLPWNALYNANFSAMELPRNQDLDNIEFPNGVSIRVVEPCTSYDLSYDDGERLQMSLRFDGVMAPEPLTATGSTFGRASHFDQIGQVHGQIVLHGESIDIDCLSMRDRTWGRRREDRPRQASYVTGCASPEEGFLAVTNVDGESNPIAYGFLRRDGKTVPIRSGERLLERDPSEGWITRIEMVAEDQGGRELRVVGRPESRIILNRHSFIDINSLIRWESDGFVAWGEDQDMWPVHRWSRTRREARSNG